MRRFDFELQIDSLPKKLMLTLASSPSIPYYTLVDLYKKSDHEILLEIASNKNITSDIAWDMVRQYESVKKEDTEGTLWVMKGNILYNLSKNPSCPIKLLQYLARMKFKYENCYKSCEISSSAINTLEKKGEIYVSGCYYITELSLKADELQEMLKSDDREKQFAAARNPILPLECMFDIVKSKDKDLKYQLSKNQAVPLDILEELIDQHDEPDYYEGEEDYDHEYKDRVMLSCIKRITDKIEGSERFHLY